MYEFVNKFGIVNFERSKKPIIALLEGLAYAHNKNIIHRDLKPSNFMVTHKGDFKIIDFGISTFLDNSGHTKLTKTGEQVAGGLYIDPLISENSGLRDARSDIYSVGAIWYFLLTGKAPSGSDMKEYLVKTANLSPIQVNLIMKCLSQNINERYDNCNALLNILNPKGKNEKSEQNEQNNLITDVTRDVIKQYFIDYYNDWQEYFNNSYSSNNEYEKVFYYHGKKTELGFLSRLYDLQNMSPSEEVYSDFEDEIGQNKYDIIAVLEDERFNLISSDDMMLKFICEMFHPLVRNEKSEWENVLDTLNGFLKIDGYEIYVEKEISKKAVYSYRMII